MLLKQVIIHKYKSFEQQQQFDLQDDITILVGMNESGKTSVLEAIAKTNYFQNDKEFKFNPTHDFPRKYKKNAYKNNTEEPKAITCIYEIDDDSINRIHEKMGCGVVSFEMDKQISITTKYNNGRTHSTNKIKVNKEIFFKNKADEIGIEDQVFIEQLLEINNKEKLSELIDKFKSEEKSYDFSLLDEFLENNWNWSNSIEEYVHRKLIRPYLPKFLYYDEYYALPSRVVLEDLQENIENLEYKTARALLELADLDIDNILDPDSFEDNIAELEATGAMVSAELFKYWDKNKNLSIEFKIESKQETINRNTTDIHGNPIKDVKIVNHILDIRVKNQRSTVSLPLKNRSKGFNWFFSFIVWFKKIQEDRDSKYILLLDEPGLNLHATAQSSMLSFLEDLSKDYQIIYTTHSPFAIPSDKLNRVRTVVETEGGSVISDSIQEKDPNTLFPLQAALGYDIAQNLFINKKNLLVEGVSDLIIITALSEILKADGKEGLREDITIVPTGGLEKVATFISLLRGSSLEIVCLLDSYTDAKGKAKMNQIIQDKIIQNSKVKFFDEFLNDYERADLEDLFTKKDYLKLFNKAFREYDDIKIADLNSSIKQIIIQLNKHLDVDRFNHYRPANEIVKSSLGKSYFQEETLSNFEKVFKQVNTLFS